MSGDCYCESINMLLPRKRALEVEAEHDNVKKRQVDETPRSVDAQVFPALWECDAGEAVVAEILRVLEENPYIPPDCEEEDNETEERSPRYENDRQQCRQLRHSCWSALTGTNAVTTLSGTSQDMQWEIRAIAHAVTKYSNNASLVACGCHDLILMAPEQPMSEHQDWARWIRENGAIRTVLDSLVTFMDNHDVQDVVTRLLYLLVMPGLCTRNVLIRENPTSILLRVMQQHCTMEELCCDVGWTLCSLLSDESNRKSFLQAQGVEQFINIMNGHFDAGRIQEPCLLALVDVFQSDETSRSQFLSSGGAELLTRTLNQHGDHDDVVHAVVAVLFKLYHSMNESHALNDVISSVTRVLQNSNICSKIQQNAMHWLFHASEISHWRSALITNKEAILSIISATSEAMPARVRYHGLFMLLDLSLEDSCRSLILDHGGIENILALPKVCRELSLKDATFWQMLHRRIGNFLLAADADTDDLTKRSFHGGSKAVVDVLHSLIP